MRESFIFYRSFYEAAKELKPNDRVKVYDAIFELGLNQTETELKGAAKAVFLAIKPQVVVNNLRYENGKKGGRKKGNLIETKEEPKVNQTEIKIKPNVKCKMLNDKCKMLNGKCEMINDDLLELFKSEFNRVFTSDEMIRLCNWLTHYGEERVIFALRNASIQNVLNFDYIDKILQNQEHEGDITNENE